MTVRGLHPESGELLRRMFLGETVPWPIHETACGTFSEETFFQDVISQGMAPLLFRRLGSETRASWPEPLLQRLHRVALQQAAFEMIAEVDLCRLLTAFAQIGVRPLLLKGTPLSYTLYPESGLRPRCDTDLLILEQDRENVAILMKKMGYAPLHEAQVDYINTQMSYARKAAQGMRCCYDIHWQVSNCNRQFSQEFSSGKIFEQAEAIPALGENAQTLNRVDALIYACFHRAGHFSHSGDRLIWLYDIHLLFQALTGQEGERFCQRAKELQIISLCTDALRTSQHWFGTRYPEAVQVVVEEKRAKQSSEKYDKYKSQEPFAHLLGSSRSDGIRQQALLELQGLPTWKKRLLYLFQNLFPPPEFMSWRYQERKKYFLPWLYSRRLLEGLLIILRK
jgi:hypothetical protein